MRRFNCTNLWVYRNLSSHATWHQGSYQIALKQGNQNPQNNMIASFSFTSRAHVPQWSNNLTQWAGPWRVHPGPWRVQSAFALLLPSTSGTWNTVESVGETKKVRNSGISISLIVIAWRATSREIYSTSRVSFDLPDFSTKIERDSARRVREIILSSK